MRIKSSIKMLIIAEFIQVDSGIEVVPMKAKNKECINNSSAFEVSLTSFIHRK